VVLALGDVEADGVDTRLLSLLFSPVRIHCQRLQSTEVEKFERPLCVLAAWTDSNYEAWKDHQKPAI